MQFFYQAIDATGKPVSGSLEAGTDTGAIAALQQQGLTVLSVSAQPGGSLQNILKGTITLFGGVSNRDVVLLSREISTLFEAQVSALRVFQLLAAQAEKPAMRTALTQISDDIQAGDPLSKALGKHPKIFSDFYINMVRAGEESGRLDQTFIFLADYLDRTFELMSKAKNALIYPAFVMVTFVGVMILMLTFIIPKITPILTESGASLPFVTQIVISASNLLVDYGIFVLVFAIVGGFFLVRWLNTAVGRTAADVFKISVPFVGDLYHKIYVSRIADNLHAMLSSGISTVRALEITSSVVENSVYEKMLLDAADAVRSGSPLSVSLANHPHEIPSILTQMIQVGEETGELSAILERLSKFYQREVNSAVDTIVSLIEPLMIILLAGGVGALLAAILIPIYNIANTI